MKSLVLIFGLFLSLAAQAQYTPQQAEQDFRKLIEMLANITSDPNYDPKDPNSNIQELIGPLINEHTQNMKALGVQTNPENYQQIYKNGGGLPPSQDARPVVPAASKTTAPRHLTSDEAKVVIDQLGREYRQSLLKAYRSKDPQAIEAAEQDLWSQAVRLGIVRGQ